MPSRQCAHEYIFEEVIMCSCQLYFNDEFAVYDIISTTAKSLDLLLHGKHFKQCDGVKSPDLRNTFSVLKQVPRKTGLFRFKNDFYS